jgi:RNA polymerase sigma-54 factor
MALKAHLTASQRLALSPMMRQSLSLLRMSAQALNDEIAHEAEENPFLVVEPAAGTGDAFEYALATSAAPESLSESLASQLAMQRLDPVTNAAALFLITELREDGYLDMSLAQLAQEKNLPIDVLQKGLAAVQRCEPAGIGARSLTEFFELKLIDAAVAPDLARMIVCHLNDFAESRWVRLHKTLGQEQSQLEHFAALLRSFASAPVTTGTTWGEPLIPELVIRRTENDQLTVELLRATQSQLSILNINKADLEQPQLKSFFDRAHQMKSGVSARLETLLRVGRYIAATQSAFFLGDHSTIFPVTRADAAAAMAVHPSTFGRAISGKAMLADNRLYPLSIFFSAPLPGNDGDISPFDVQRKIRNMISGECAETPHSDEKICAQLRHEGVDIARRTVAKYRKCMRIPSSFARRRRKT